MKTIPKKKTNNDILLLDDNLLYRDSAYPKAKLAEPHNTLVNGDEFPNPGGLPKGEGNGFPEMPLTKCGTKFAKKTPAKNASK